MPLNYFSPQNYTPGDNLLINSNFDLYLSALINYTSGVDYSVYDLLSEWRTDIKCDGGGTVNLSQRIVSPTSYSFQGSQYAFMMDSEGGTCGATGYHFIAQKIPQGASNLCITNKKLTASMLFWAGAIGRVGVALYVNYGTGGSTAETIPGKVYTGNTAVQKIQCIFNLPDPSSKTITADNYVELRIFFAWGATTAAVNFSNTTTEEDYDNMIQFHTSVAKIVTRVKLELGETVTDYVPMSNEAAIMECSTPIWRAWIPVLNWSGATPSSVATTARYCTIGKVCFISIMIQSADTNGCTGLSMTAPLTAAAGCNYHFQCLEYYGTGYALIKDCGAYVASGTNTINFSMFSAGTDNQPIYIQGTGFFEVA